MSLTAQQYLTWAILIVTCLPLACRSTDPVSGGEEWDGTRITSTCYALVNGTIIDGTGAGPMEKGVLVIKGQEIIAVGVEGSVNIPQEARVVDVQGATILPGFINAHVHYTDSPTRLAAWAYEGVTMVRDVGTSIAQFQRSKWQQENESNAFYTSVIFTGPIMNIPEGVPHGPYGLVVASVDEARIGASYLLDLGVDMIKVYLDERELYRSMPLEFLQEIVKTAHARGKRVTVHAQENHLLARAIDAGADDIAHPQLYEVVPDSLIHKLVQKDIYVVSTLEIYLMGTAQERAMARINIGRFAEKGVKVALGTDFDIRFNMQLGMPTREIQFLKEAGLSPMQIIVAATKHGAAVCGLGDKLGTLENGKIADVLIVKGNPLADLTSLSKVKLVIHNGINIRAEK